jgi:hypothetical protein
MCVGQGGGVCVCVCGGGGETREVMRDAQVKAQPGPAAGDCWGVGRLGLGLSSEAHGGQSGAVREGGARQNTDAATR